MSDKSRIIFVDALRGFALLGILLVNSVVFAMIQPGGRLAPFDARSPLDAGLAFVLAAGFELKFYLLFSFLFGYSVTLQMRSAQKAGSAFLPRMLRRQAGLLLIGALHAVFLFHGDILTTYAVLGLLLLALSRTSHSFKVHLAVLLLAFTALFWLAIAVLQSIMPPDADGMRMVQEAQLALAAYRGPPEAIIRQHGADLMTFLPLLLLLQAPCALAMFLIGFICGERQMLAQPERYRPLFRTIVKGAVRLGLPGALIYAAATSFLPGTALETAALALSVLTAPFLSAGVAVAVFMLFSSRRLPMLFDVLAAAGRMALSNYLAQSALCALIFHGYGLALIGRLSLAATLLVALAVFMAQLAFSRWWLSRFRYGPAEWLLRAITIGGWP